MGGQSLDPVSGVRCQMFPRVEKIHRTSRWQPAPPPTPLASSDTVFCLPKHNSTQEEISLWDKHTEVKSQAASETAVDLKLSSQSKTKETKSSEVPELAVKRLWSLLDATASALSSHTLASSFTCPSQNWGRLFFPSRWKPSEERFRLMFLARFPFRASPLDGICAPLPHGSPTLL